MGGQKVMTVHIIGALHRATVASPKIEAPVTVFFEVAWEQATKLDLGLHVGILLACAWDLEMTDLQVQDVVRERPLIARARGHVSTGDLRMFENGYWRGPLYCEPDRTVLLVCPTTLRRLVAAQRRLPVVDASASMPMPLTAQA